jgi:hypothetical protein
MTPKFKPRAFGRAAAKLDFTGTCMLAGCLFALLSPVTAGWGQDIEVPVALQSKLFCRVLMFDRNLAGEPMREIVIGILYQERFRTSLEVKTEFEDGFREAGLDTLSELPVRLRPMSFNGLEELDGLLSVDSVDVLYLAPLRAVNVEQITALCRKYRILTITGVPEYIPAGVSVGVELKGGKPQIVINTTAAKAEGADFSSQLLKIVKVVNQEDK